MPFTIVRNDITNMQVDAIVNAAGRYPVVGTGVDAAIHQKAGPQLLTAREKIGQIAPGSAAVTPAFALPAKYVIHTATPHWVDGQQGELALLRSAYDKCLQLAAKKNCHSVAFPLLASGNHGFPKDLALQAAIGAFSQFLLTCDMEIYLVVFGADSVHLSEKLVQNVASYIDDHYIEIYEKKMSQEVASFEHRMRQSWAIEKADKCMPAPCASAPVARSLSLDDYLKEQDAGFTETLLRMIDKKGCKDSVVYKKANLSKQHFSKIRNNPDYKPTKQTAIALALALELNVRETNDLIGRAGYTLSNSSKFDLIIRYFIEKHIYNIVEINIALYEFDQALLG